MTCRNLLFSKLTYRCIRYVYTPIVFIYYSYETFCLSTFKLCVL